MSARVSMRWTCLLLLTLAVPVSASGEGKYRQFSLGSTSASVRQLTGSVASDLKTVHARPSLLQELAWRPRSSAGRALTDVDSVQEVVFSFQDDQLYRIAVYYDRLRTAGLTHNDLILALSDTYGAPSPKVAPAAHLGRFEPSDATIQIARWERGDTLVALYWSDYRAGFGLLVRSQALEESARAATAAAVTLDESEAPAREAARQKKDAEDREAAEERTRATNKGAFRP